MNEDERAEADVRDRGFGRARVLIVLPMRNVALKYIQRLHDLVTVGSDAEANAANEGRFRTLTSDFSELPEAVDPSFKRRPTEFKRLFDGNINDTFCVGLALRPGTMRVYANVLESDIVVCSTLGLLKRMAKDADLSVALSSIEVAIVDMAHVILMQNWQHVRTILLRHLNRRPKDTTEGLNDLRRVFSWALKGQMRRHRQTIVVSDISHAQILQTMREGCANNSGRVVWTTPMTGVAGTGDGASGVLGAAPAKLRQQYVRFHASSVETVDDERFTHFTQKLFPTKIQPLVDRNVRVILYVPSYFDFVRVQAWLHEHHRFAYCAISEHSTPKEQRAALGQFTDQERQILVLTERFYFFQRYFVRLGEVLFFYSPPLFPSFYTHLLGKLALESPNAQGMVFYSRYDAHELARLVGAARTQQLLTRPAEAYLFLSDGAVAK
jgi:U3 small nucleolar RNA-associated protein 25